ncbi:MAG: VCBS repeat-containing protein, partial [Bacteroidota bacterium]
RGVHASDLDQDGDVDILTASQDNNRVAWYENIDQEQRQFSSIQIINDDLRGAWQVFAGDMDGDLDQDVISGSFLDTDNLWYQNLGQGNFGSEQLISSLARRSVVVHLADLDTDGDMDVLTGSQEDASISWYQNDGQGHFGPEKIITQDIGEIVRLVDEDLDQDGDRDLLAASFRDNKIVWYENDGRGNFSPEILITNQALEASGVYATDIDGDQDLDVITCSFRGDEVLWFENDGRGNFFQKHRIETIIGAFSDVQATDLNGDGFADILLASESGKISWHQNDGRGNFGETLIITSNASSSNEVYAADFDGDGDMDVVTVASGNGQLAWYENRQLEEDQRGSITIRRDSSLALVCSGDSVLLFAESSLSEGRIQWLNEEGVILAEGNEYYVNRSGTYRAFTQEFCDSIISAPLQITFPHPPSQPEISPPLDSVFFCPGKTLILRPKRREAASEYFWWKDNQLLGAADSLLVREAGIYQLQVKNVCGELFSEEYALHPIEIFVPDRFSPNQDGQNDLFTICVNQPLAVERMRLVIYDRQGHEVFQSEESIDLLCQRNPSQERGWDGQGVEAGLYIWQLRIFLKGCQQKEMQGRVWLNR